MKTIVSLLFALILTLSAATVSAGAAFTDASAITYPEAVEQLSDLKVIGGYGDGSFRPKGTLSRGAAAKIITGMMLTAEEIAALPTDTAPYPDVPAGSTYAGYVTFLKSKGVIGGYADGTFRPGNELSRTAFLKMLLGALGYSAETEEFFGDNGSRNILIKAMLVGLPTGHDDFLSAAGSCTREEAALYAYNALACDTVTYKSGKAVSTGKTCLETRFPAAAAAEKAAALAGKVVNEGDQLLTVPELYCRPAQNGWIVSVRFPEATTNGPDSISYKSNKATPAAPDGDTWSITIWDKEGGTKLGTYTAETTKAAGEYQSLSVPIACPAARCGGSAYAEITVTCVDDAGKMTARYSCKQTFDDLADYDTRNDGPINEASVESLAAALAYSMGVEPPAHAASANGDITAYVDQVFGGKKADRLFIYDGDAIAQWLMDKYPDLFADLRERTDLEVPLHSVLPSKTPVNFGSIYTGAAPEVHGITQYEKKLITIDTLFDAMVRAGKKVALVARRNYSMSTLFNERPIDYYYCSTYAEVNTTAARLIMEDEYDMILCYNGNFDDVMHKVGPEAPEALDQLRYNVQMYAMFDTLIRHCWTEHNTLMTFGMDHGCHTKNGSPEQPGAHGSADPVDANILHLFKGHPAVS